MANFIFKICVLCSFTHNAVGIFKKLNGFYVLSIYYPFIRVQLAPGVSIHIDFPYLVNSGPQLRYMYWSSVGYM